MSGDERSTSSTLQSRTVYDRLKHMVVNQELGAGHHLHVSRLSEQLAVSMTPVREALMRLYGEQLIVSTTSRGFFTRVLDVAELSGLFELAYALLQYSIDHHAEQMATDFASADVSVFWTGATCSTEVRSSDRFVVEVEAVYIRLVAATRNAELIGSIRNFNDRTRFVRVIDLSDASNRMKVADETTRLIAHLAAADRGAAVHDVRSHFDEIRRRLPHLVKAWAASHHGS